MFTNIGPICKLSWLVVALVILAAVGATSGGASTGTTANASAVGKEQPFDCSRLREMGLEKQTNIRAAQILAACQGRKADLSRRSAAPVGPVNKAVASAATNAITKLNPQVYGGTDQNVILPDGTYPHTVQSESMVWGHGNTIVINYNDSRAAPSCYAGLSYSTNGGNNWTRPGGTGASPICMGHGTNFGDPIVVYNNSLSTWFAGDLATGCGGQGVGLWTSPDGVTWSTGACAANMPGGAGDRESMWVDNNPSSPHYGRMYISSNNFAVGSGALQVVYSDDGNAWSAPITVSGTCSFMRNVQATGSSTGTVFIASMNEGGGGLNRRQNVMFRSTDGGNTWTSSTTGPAFPAPGVATSGYFALMFPTIWRFEGWGQPAVGPGGVVHYVYTQHGPGSDAGDMMYVRSTDNGSTWSTPLQLNTDTSSGRPNWQGSLAASVAGGLLATWYDGREAASCGSPGANILCYRRYGRVSWDNGATWQYDDMIGDSMSPLPAEPDPAINPVYEGDYDNSSADGLNLYTAWNDGRVLINGTSQQDLFFDKVSMVLATPTPTVPPCQPIPCTNTPTSTPTSSTPTRTHTRTYTPVPTATVCGNYATSTSTATIVPGTTDTGNHTDDGTTQITFPFPVIFYYNQTYTTGSVSSNGNLQFVMAKPAFDNSCLPDTTMGPAIFPHWGDLRTDTTCTCPAGCGIYISISGTAPNRIFNIEWRTYYHTGAGNANFEIRLYENSSHFDVILGTLDQSGSSATIGVQDGAGRFTQFECNTQAQNGVRVAFDLLPCEVTATATDTHAPTSIPTHTHTATRTSTLTGTPTNTSSPTVTATHTPTPTATIMETFTPLSTVAPTLTLIPTPPPTLVPTPCTIGFSDVHPSDYFYASVVYLACHGVISGYGDGTFRSYNNTTRGQLTKIVTLAEGWALLCSTQHFSDVPPSQTFYCYIETAYSRGIISGYADGTFRPGNDVTRGQLCKIVVLAEGWADSCVPPGHFSDVPPSNPFFCYVETAYGHDIITGYADGTFRPGNSATRGQICKIIYSAITGP